VNTETQRAILSIALLAAFADGDQQDSERGHIRRLADNLAGEAPALDLPQLVQDVLLKRVSLAQLLPALGGNAHRQLAYEMAVCVCDADGVQSAAEQRFLAELKQALGLSRGQTEPVEQEADRLAELIGEPAAVPPPSLPAPLAAQPAAAIDQAALDKSILNYAMLNGALELLPQSWASVAIIPLQMKMVYAIGQAHGVELDRGHVKEFIAAAGIGFGSQYLEQFGRKLIGGLLGKALGRTGCSIGGAATGVAFSFATTYALGQLARRYYAGGRQMSTALLRQTFQDLLAPAKQLQLDYLPQIQQKARSLDAAQIMKLVKP